MNNSNDGKKPRKIIFEILCEVLLKNKYSNVLLQRIDRNEQLSVRDRSFICQIVYGTIKNKIYLEYVMNKLINSRKTNIKIKIIIMMSLYQHVYLDKVPAYAIVNEAVELAKEINSHYAGFVNAVLKNITNGDEDKFAIKTESVEAGKLIKYSFPEFLYAMLVNQFGNRDAEKVLLDSANNAKITFRLNTLKLSHEDLMSNYRMTYDLKRSEVCRDGYVANNQIYDSQLFRDGMIYLQDEMSILVAESLNPKPDDVILDMCAAPGGKTTGLSQIMNNQGKIVACDISSQRVKMIEQNIKRMGATNVEIKTMNVLEWPATDRFDKILLDAPCSGFGVLKRKPEIKYHHWNNEKIAKIVDVQYELLEKSYELLKQDGEMVYSTCTFNLYENQQQIDSFLQRHSDMEVLEENQHFGYENNTDGFYICRLHKLPEKEIVNDKER